MVNKGEPPGRPVRRVVSGTVVTAAIMVTLALPLTIVGLLQAPSEPLSGGEFGWTVGLCLMLHVTCFLCSRWPAGAFVAGSALMLALAFTVVPGLGSAAMLPSSVAYLLLLWRLASGDDRRRSNGALAVGLAGAGIVVGTEAMRSGVQDPMSLLFETGSMVAAIIAAWALGALARQYRLAETRRVQESTRLAVAEERTRISRDLHDVVSHSLTVMIAQTEAARIVIGSHGASSASDRDDALEKVAEVGREAMRGLRSMIRTLDAPGATPLTPSAGIDAIPGLVAHARSAEHVIEFAARGTPRRLAPDADLAAFRVAQEAVTNAIRHVRPPVRLGVEVDWGDSEVVITVSDDGGRGLLQHSDQGGTGLISLTERVQRAGGSLQVRQEEGWRVRATLPIEEIA